MSQIINSWRGGGSVAQRPLLERVDEVDDDPSSRNPENANCMRYFGIKSYLHNFYDKTPYREQDLQYRYLTRACKKKFSSRWWKFSLWFGTICVSLGFLIILVGFLFPRKKIEISSDAELITVDRQALEYNQNLDFCRLFGISLFVFGGIIFTISLFLPTFCHMYCSSGSDQDEQNMYADPFKVRLTSEETVGSSNPVPSTSTLKPIQPNYRKDESRLRTDGLVPIQTF